MIARALCGLEAMGCSSQPEYGWVPIQQNAPHPLFSGLESTFISSCVHQDEVTFSKAPLLVFAHSADCENQAFQVEGKRAFGIQFHPEHTLQVAQRTYKELKKRKKAHWFQNVTHQERYYDPQVGQTIFKNFFELAK